jgi:hypothetical protein
MLEYHGICFELTSQCNLLTVPQYIEQHPMLTAFYSVPYPTYAHGIGHTVRLSLHARIIVVADLLPSFWAAHGCNTGIKLVFNENSKMLKVPTPNSNLNLVTFTFHYINPTNAQQMHFSPVNKTVCPLECAALTSHSSASPNTILYPHLGQSTGTKRASNWYSTELTFTFTTPIPPTINRSLSSLLLLPGQYRTTHFHFFTKNMNGVSVRVRDFLLAGKPYSKGNST